VPTWRPDGRDAEKRAGMEPDDLLCSRNARPQKALVGRAQWKINQPPSLKRERASLEKSIFGRSLRPCWDVILSILWDIKLFDEERLFVWVIMPCDLKPSEIE
jgi:hypothetical protein